MRRSGITLISIAVLLLCSAPVYADLINRGNGLIYDTDLNVTFLQNANLAATQTFGVPGIDSGGWMTWYTANSWIAAMNVANYKGYDDWRLPASNDNAGYYSTSDMGHLYYLELGGVAAMGYSTAGPFINLPNDVWTSHTASWNRDCAFYFSFGRSVTPGYSTGAWKNGEWNTRYSVWPVLDGDVPQTPIPEPSTFVLLTFGCAVLIGLGLRHGNA